MKNLPIRAWLVLGVFNLVLVALLGTLMRYKIGFEFPYFSQKYIQHAHSHFAFAGWISHILMVLLVVFIKNYTAKIKFYKWAIYGNLFVSYGMLVTFFVQGYALFSIIFSSLSLLISFVFCVMLLSDLQKVENQHPSKNYFVAALLFNILSMFGTLSLIYMMANKYIPQNQYLASVYFYLHFQYNGWFLFSIIGLILLFIRKHVPDLSYQPLTFWLFAGACLPAYGLSVLWLKLPLWVYLLVVLAALLQVVAWWQLFGVLKKYWGFIKKHLSSTEHYVFVLLAVALSVKIALQAISVVPQVSHLAFAFRPIVIAYLHLVLLAITSVFLLNYLFSNDLLQKSKLATASYILFLAGVFGNEVALGVQGIAAIGYLPVPYINEILFFLALLMFTSILVLFLDQIKQKSSKLRKVLNI